MPATADRPAEGLVIYQPTQGYRYNADSFWLAGYALEVVDQGHALDLCTGSGVVAFLLARTGLRVTGVDVFPAWSELWDQSLAHSRVQPELLQVDARTYRPAMRFDLITCNPPFFPINSGPIPQNPSRAAARAELSGGLADFLSCAAALLHPQGHAVFVLPRTRSDEAEHLANRLHLHTARRIFVGKKRCLFDFTPYPTTEPIREDVLSGGERCDALYARAIG